MVTTTLHEAQHELEAVRNQLWRRFERGELTIEQVMGQVSDWQLQIGDDTFLLHPPTGQWLVLDRVHDNWVPFVHRAAKGPLARVHQNPVARMSRRSLVWIRWVSTLAGLMVMGVGLTGLLGRTGSPPVVTFAPTTTTTQIEPTTSTTVPNGSTSTVTVPTTSPPVASSATATCTNEEAAFTVEYPADWFAGGTDLDGPCALFDPEPIDGTSGSESAIALSMIDWPFDELVASYDNEGVIVHENTPIAVAGRRAARIHYTFVGDGSEPEISGYDVVIEYGDGVYLLTTLEPFSNDFEATRTVADAMVASLVFYR